LIWTGHPYEAIILCAGFQSHSKKWFQESGWSNDFVPQILGRPSKKAIESRRPYPRLQRQIVIAEFT
jgi:hypothetical protein